MACLAGAALLAGCSAVKLGYSQADTLAWWWLDGYVDFDRQQKPQVQQALADWLAWHRRTQLPEYADWLAPLAGQITQPVSAEQACAWVDKLQPALHAAWQQALPAIARQVQTLQPAQLRHIQRKLDEKNRDFREEQIDATEAERHTLRLKTWRERYDDLYGRLNPAQDKLLADAATRLAPDPLQREAEHLAHQRELMALLHSLSANPPGDAATQAALAAWLRPSATLGGWGSSAWQARQRQLRQGHCELFAQMHQASTPAQRDHAAQWLRGWEQDLREMAGR